MRSSLVCSWLIRGTLINGLMLSTARILRSLGAVGAIAEVGKIGEEAYVPTKVTRTFVIPALAAGVQFWYVTSLSHTF